VQARYAGDRQWYSAKIVGRKGDLYIIKWALDSWPHFRGAMSHGGGKEATENGPGVHAAQSEGEVISDAGTTGQGEGRELDKIKDLLKDSTDLRRANGEQCAVKGEGRGKQMWGRVSGRGATGMALRMTATLKAAANVTAQTRKLKAKQMGGEREEEEELSHSPVSGRMLHPDKKRHQAWKSMSHPFWHPRMPVKAPMGMTRRRAVGREEEDREMRRTPQMQQFKGEEEEREAATLHFRRVEASLVTLTGAEVAFEDHCVRARARVCARAGDVDALPTKQEVIEAKPPESPIFRMAKQVFSRMRKHERHNPHYSITPTTTTDAVPGLDTTKA
jgi:hypothetical protein